MNTRRHRKHGYTLAEILIVLAIIAMLSGLAIPAVIKIGGFMSKKSDQAARDLYGVLRAARISAISYRLDTAVVYAVHPRLDNFNGAQSYIIDGYGTATRATKAQIDFIRNPPNVIISDSSYQGLEDSLAVFAAHLDSQDLQESDIFVLSQEPQARFRPMPTDTALIGHLTAQEEQTIAASGFLDEPPQSIEEFVDGFDDAEDPARMYEGLRSRGMRIVYLFHVRDADDYLEPINANPQLNSNFAVLPPDVQPYSFPAHVFLTTGELGAPGSSLDRSLKERITIAIGPAPDAPIEDRFTATPEENGGLAIMAAPVRIELYRSTGRVQIAS